jgi:hypothetical protein
MIRKLHGSERETDDPLAGVANFLDLGIVFAAGILLALVSYINLPELLTNQEITVIKNPGTPEMEIIHKKGIKMEHYRVSREKMTGEGRRLGMAYRLKTGEVVYVPEDESNNPESPSTPENGKK